MPRSRGSEEPEVEWVLVPLDIVLDEPGLLPEVSLPLETLPDEVPLDSVPVPPVLPDVPVPLEKPPAPGTPLPLVPVPLMLGEVLPLELGEALPPLGEALPLLTAACACRLQLSKSACVGSAA
jgi:hypothetical protein